MQYIEKSIVVFWKIDANTIVFIERFTYNKNVVIYLTFFCSGGIYFCSQTSEEVCVIAYM